MKPSAGARLAALWSRHAWSPRVTGWMRLLLPLSWLYGWLVAQRSRPVIGLSAGMPVIVVGNWVVGGAGKTPTVIALVQALAARGWTPGVVSRGYGRAGDGVAAVGTASSAAEVGDEPLLIHRRAGVRVVVARDRVSALDALCVAKPAVDVVVADDGLQHMALARVAELWVFDDRGIGNGCLLPAGPLRAPLPGRVPAFARVLYTGSTTSTSLPGSMAMRGLSSAVPLAAWWSGDASTAVPLQALPRGGLHALAGIAAPEKFFSMLEARGLRFTRIAMPDHAAYTTLPWPASATDVLVTEKDAVKLDPQRIGSTPRIWVVPLDFELPRGLVDDLVALLPQRPRSELTP